MITRSPRTFATRCSITLQIAIRGRVHAISLRRLAGPLTSGGVSSLLVSGPIAQHVLALRVDAIRSVNLIPITVIPLTPIAFSISAIDVAVSTGIDIVAAHPDATSATFTLTPNHSSLITTSHARCVAGGSIREPLGAGPVVTSLDVS